MLHESVQLLNEHVATHKLPEPTLMLFFKKSCTPAASLVDPCMGERGYFDLSEASHLPRNDRNSPAGGLQPSR